MYRHLILALFFSYLLAFPPLQTDTVDDQVAANRARLERIK